MSRVASALQTGEVRAFSSSSSRDVKIIEHGEALRTIEEEDAMSIRFGILTGAAVATAIVLAATGTAFAQAAGRGGGTPGDGQDETKVITYGTPGNCPPTVAGCGDVQKPRPVIKKKYDPCGDFAEGSAAYRECKRKK
jgi:hypothetical protein